MLLNEQTKINIFLIDDSAVDTFLSQKILEKSPYINEITSFSDSQGALDFILNPDNVAKLPQLVLLDINMPLYDGFEFIDMLEESELFEDEIPFSICLLTNSKQKRDIEKFERQTSITEFIQKPIDLDQLNSIIENRLVTA